ncbi:MAG: hypothetical protein RMJ36_04310 [Candidatus Calescibacterium sp.]|nr:hypothetical protein [Candidatus Calescibacterium sp.]MDW8132860.1 hypothetical protein [Candidatus Calescibacterium sp.]
MSILSLGAIFLIGSTLAMSSALLATAIGTGSILITNDNQDRTKLLFNQINSNINDQETQKRLLLENLENFSKMVNQTLVNREFSNQKEQIIERAVDVSKILKSNNIDYYGVQQKIGELVKDYNELVVNNRVLLSNKQELYYQITKILKDMNDQSELDKIQQIGQNLNDIKLSELEDILKTLEQKYLSISISSNVSEKDLLIQKIYNILDRIKQIDFEYYNKISFRYLDLNKLDDSYLRVLLDQANLDFSDIKLKIIRTEIFSEQLKRYYSFVSNFLDFFKDDQEFKITNYYPLILKSLQDINDLLSKKYIDKEEFEKLQFEISNLINAVQKYMEHKHIRSSLKRNLKEALEEIGYSLVDSSVVENLLKGQVIYLDLPYSQDHKVQIKLTDDNQIYFRLVRFVDSPNLTEYEKQQDVYISQKWCEDYDKILQLLSNYGIIIENMKRIEPGQIEMLYILKEEKRKKREHQKYQQIE